MARKHVRSHHGGIYVLEFALIVCIVLVLFFFGNQFMQIVGNHQEQETAIESAALAAAKAVGRIVVEEPGIGFVGLSNRAPTGKATTAGDNYFLPVHSINSLMATARLDMIVADLLKDPVMQTCAKADCDRLVSARTDLVRELVRCSKRGQTSLDVDGNVVDPWTDALNAYMSNKVHLTSGASVPIQDSLTLTLGCVQGSATSTPVPNPGQFANITQDQQKDGFYVAYEDVPYKDQHFVFAATAANTSLVDLKQFTTTVPGLPYSIPSVVECQMDHQFNTLDMSNRPQQRIVHMAACAEPACEADDSPSPGKLALSFPQGTAPEMHSLQAILTNLQLCNSPTDVIEIPQAGDYPVAPLVLTSLPELNNDQHPPFGKVLRVALYDWIRRGGEIANVQSILDAISAELTSSSTGIRSNLTFKKDGSVEVQNEALAASPELPVSNMQYRAVSGEGLRTNADPIKKLVPRIFDVIVKDYCYQRGRQSGGIHAGELLGDLLPPEPSSVTTRLIDDAPSNVALFKQGPSGGADRYTYNQGGISAEIRFRLR